MIFPFKRDTYLVELDKAAGREHGLNIQNLGSGGESDANNTSAIGITMLDDMGVGGCLAHNPGEFIELDYLPTRIE